MKVTAIKIGFIHGNLRKVGDEFECSEQEFSKTWMSEDKKDIPVKLDNSNVKSSMDVKHESLEIPSLMHQFKEEKKEEVKEEKKAKPKKTTKKVS